MSIVPEASVSFEGSLRLGKEEREDGKEMVRGKKEGKKRGGEGRKESNHSEVLNKMEELWSSHIHMVMIVFSESNKMCPG